jgi:hypothetical protein
MTRAIRRDAIYRGRRFQSEVIELCVRWYITYRLSYRDLVAMMAERDIKVSHTTIMRWVLRYVPEFEERWARYAQRVKPSWRVDPHRIPKQLNEIKPLRSAGSKRRWRWGCIQPSHWRRRGCGIEPPNICLWRGRIPR